MRKYVFSSLTGTVALAIALAVTTPARAGTTDAWVTTKVKMALLTSDGVSSTAVNVDTIDGRVTLHGTVGSAADKDAANRAAQTIAGVREVRNLLAVVPPPAQEQSAVADETVGASVEAALEREPALADSDIEVASVNGGIVVLSGEAESLSDHLRAIEVTRATPGVRRVASQIQAPDELTEGEMWQQAGDSATQAGAAVADAARRTGEAIGAAGQKTFDGAAAAGKQAGAAVRDGSRAAAGTVSDAWITSAAKLRLLANTTTPGFDINVDTRRGAVTLFGTVPSAEARRAAEAEVRAVSGVTSIDNQLAVVPPAAAEAVATRDAELEQAVAARLERADEIGDDVAIEVSDGVVRLTGTVDNQTERLQALTIARSTAGVRAVVDGLQVESDRHAAR